MTFNALTISLVFVFLALAILLLFRSRRLHKRSGMPVGKVVYTDTGAWHPNIESLYSRELRLAGRPDYLVRQVNGAIIPVEVKSSRAPEEPWEGHILQLAAYCLLVEEMFGTRPEYGILQYKDHAFAIDYTADLEADLLDLLAEMRAAQNIGEVDRDHSDWRRCARCGLNHKCFQRLA
ncbi:MAG: Dna2/Cas4 domain-containing protein [Anaerolineales bacterium]|nr:Dna2/Cas4 domain-containing protein [Anaerolineales bacterium]